MGFFRTKALESVNDERDRQDAKWGPQRGLPIVSDEKYRRYFAQMESDYKFLNDDCSRDGGDNWAFILLEEVFEALAESDIARVRKEMTQVAAVAVAIIEDIDSRENS